MDHELTVQRFVLARRKGVQTGNWRNVHTLYAGKEDRVGLTVYADHATGRRESVKFTVRDEVEITRHLRIVEQGAAYMIANISRKGADLLEITAVSVQDCPCTVSRPLDDGVDDDALVMEVYARFPGVFAERYLRHVQLVPHDQIEESYILVTPKAVQLEAGDLVAAMGKSFAVQLAHTLDPYRNEYELCRKGDV